MGNTTTSSFLSLVAGRRGHFKLESGYHSSLWLDLDALFSEPKQIRPFVDELAGHLTPYSVDAVCGPLLGGAFLAQQVAMILGTAFYYTERVSQGQASGLYPAQYRLPPALRHQLKGKRVALVDDVMSAGSALRSTYSELRAQGAVSAVTGALLVLGSTGADFFLQRGIAVEAVARDEFEMWHPTSCPLCAAGVTLEDTSSPDA